MKRGALDLAHTILAGRGAEVDATNHRIDGGAGDDAAVVAAGNDLRSPVRKQRWIARIPGHAVRHVGAVAIEDVVGAVFVADSHHVAALAADVDGEEVGHCAEREVALIDLARTPAPERIPVEVDGEDRLVERRHGRRRDRGRGIVVRVAIGGSGVERAALEVHGG